MGVFNATLGAKRIELTKELMPGADRIAHLLNPSNPSSEIESKGALAAAGALRVELHLLNASTEYELDTAFADVAKLRAGVLVVSGEPYFDSQRERLVALSARHSIAAVYAWREYVLAGGLMSYGTLSRPPANSAARRIRGTEALRVVAKHREGRQYWIAAYRHIGAIAKPRSIEEVRATIASSPFRRDGYSYRGAIRFGIRAFFNDHSPDLVPNSGIYTGAGRVDSNSLAARGTPFAVLRL